MEEEMNFEFEGGLDTGGNVAATAPPGTGPGMGMHGAPGAGGVLGDGVGSGQSLAMGLVTQQLNSNKNYRQVGGFVPFVPVAVCMLRLPRADGTSLSWTRTMRDAEARLDAGWEELCSTDEFGRS